MRRGRTAAGCATHGGNRNMCLSNNPRRGGAQMRYRSYGVLGGLRMFTARLSVDMGCHRNYTETRCRPLST